MNRENVYMPGWATTHNERGHFVEVSPSHPRVVHPREPGWGTNKGNVWCVLSPNRTVHDGRVRCEPSQNVGPFPHMFFGIR